MGKPPPDQPGDESRMTSQNKADQCGMGGGGPLTFGWVKVVTIELYSVQCIVTDSNN